MKDLVKRYLPYGLVLFGMFMIVPLFFGEGRLISADFIAVALYFVFLIATVAAAAIYCSKHGIDFLFTLIAPISFLIAMLIYFGGFTITNIILIVVYLVAGIFGMFLGDLAFGEERRKREQKEKREAEEIMLQANRRDAYEREKMQKNRAESQERSVQKKPQRPNRPNPQSQRTRKPEQKVARNDDDFNYDKYVADIDKHSSAEDEIDAILRDLHS